MMSTTSAIVQLLRKVVTVQNDSPPTILIHYFLLPMSRCKCQKSPFTEQLGAKCFKMTSRLPRHKLVLKKRLYAFLQLGGQNIKYFVPVKTQKLFSGGQMYSLPCID